MSLLVSIIIPCYNQGHYLEETLKSVLNQTHTDWECLLIDDGSTDTTAEIIEKWIKKDIRFRYFKKENSGVSATRNYGLASAKGDYIQFLDADDCIDKTKLDQSVVQVTSNPEINIVFTNFAMFSNAINETKAPYCILNPECFSKERILYSWNDSFSIPIHCSFIKKEVLENISFPTELTAQEDWFFWIKVFQKRIKIGFIDSPLAFYRINPKSRTLSGSMLDDQMLVYQMFKEILSIAEYDELSRVLIKRYYTQKETLTRRNVALKNSNTYQTGLLIKRILKRFGLLRIAQKTFKKSRQIFKIN